MKRVLLVTILVAVCTFLSGWFLAWWWFAPFVGIIGFWSKLSISKVSAASFSGIFLVWFGLSMLFDSMNASLLSQKVAQILQIPNRMWLITTASTLVATVGSMAAVTGALLRKIINV